MAASSHRVPPDNIKYTPISTLLQKRKADQWLIKPPKI